MSALESPPDPSQPSGRQYYPLTEEESCWMTQTLTPSALSLLLFIRTRDPVGNRMTEIETSQIAAKLGLSERTIQKALTELAEQDRMPRGQPQALGEIERGENLTHLPQEGDEADRASAIFKSREPVQMDERMSQVGERRSR